MFIVRQYLTTGHKGDRNGESLLNNFSSVLLHSNSLAVATSPFLHLLYHQCNRGSSKQ